MSVVPVPKDGTLLDVLAERYRAAFDKVKGGRAAWIEGTLELAGVLLEARRDIPDHVEYGRWVKRHGLKPINDNDRSALIWLADNARARAILESANSVSWQHIVRKEKKAAPGQVTKGRKRNKHDASGSQKRKRAAAHHRMLDPADGDVVPQPKPPRHLPPPEPGKRLSDRALTREQVDPDFVGDSVAFATEYGHVLLRTKEEIKENKRQEALMAWLETISGHHVTARKMFAAVIAGEPAAFQEWMSKPGKAAKFQMWCKGIKAACDELMRLTGVVT